MNNKLNKYVLDNGVTVYFYNDPNKHSVYAKLFVKYGSGNLDFKIGDKEYHIDNGVAHLLEHFVFEHNICGNFLNVFGSKQMTCNASTSNAHTEYWFKTVENIEFGIENLIKGVNNAVINEENINKVKPPIYREIQMGCDNELKRRFSKSNENLFCKSRFINGLGTEEYLKTLDADFIKMIYNTFYQPKNQILIVGGNFDSDKILELIKENYKEYENTVDFEFLPVNEPKEVRKKYDVIKMPTGKPLIEFWYKIDISNLSDEERLRYDYYLSFFYEMNFGNMSALYKELTEKKIIVGSIGTTSWIQKDCFLFALSTRTEYEEEFTLAIKNQLENIIFDEELYELFLKDCKVHFISSDEGFVNKVNNLTTKITLFNTDRITTVEDINRLSFAEMKEFISKTDFSNYTTLRLENLEEKDQ